MPFTQHCLPRFGGSAAEDWRWLIGDSGLANRERRPLRLVDPIYGQKPLHEHSNWRISELIHGIRELRLELNLHAGTAAYSGGGSDGVDVLKLTNGAGFDFEFEIHPGTGKTPEDDGVVHALWLKVEPDRQGSFWKLATFFNQVATLLLDCCSYRLIWGRAIWSSNSRVRGLRQPDIKRDWRALPVFCGFDASLNPLIHEGLLALYLRMGFVHLPDEELENLVVYPSRREAARLANVYGKSKWDEMTQLAFARRHEWRQVQRKRKAMIPDSEERKRQAVELAVEAFQNQEDNHEKLCHQLMQKRFSFDSKLYPFLRNSAPPYRL